jgi:hypothetical protein
VELASLTRFFTRGDRGQARPPEPLPPLWFDREAELVLAPPAPAVEGDEEAWWHSEYGSWRLAAEVGAMRRFPGFRATVGGNGLLRWTGWLESALPPGRSYYVRVAYPACFPDEAPLVSILRPELPHEVPHLLSGQRPCLYRGGYRDGYDPARTTAATLVAWTALWIHAFETWQTTGRWPGAAA